MRKILLLLFSLFALCQASAQWLGTNPVYFNAGNVGIGTATPSVWFGAKTFEFADYRPVLKLSSISTGLSTIVFTNTSVNATTHIGEFHLNYQYNATNSNKSNLIFHGYPGSSALSIQADGNIGIGTTNPTAKLEILQTTPEDPAVQVSSLMVVPQLLNGSWNGISKLGDAGIIMKNGQALVIAPHQSATSGLRIDGITGNVGIGTPDPKGYKLAVAGKAVAEEVTVKLQANWPDYVFNDDYKLLSLEEIKTYIDKNKHLPEVPSAKEMEANGVNLGEMNMLLLKKVEELTLHIIDQNSELRKQKIQNENLLRRLQALEKVVTDKSK